MYGRFELNKRFILKVFMAVLCLTVLFAAKTKVYAYDEATDDIPGRELAGKTAVTNAQIRDMMEEGRGIYPGFHVSRHGHGGQSFLPCHG